MKNYLDELRRLHERASKAWAAFESSQDLNDSQTKASPKHRVVAERIQKIGDALDGRCSINSLDFLPYLTDMRGLYWDDPRTAVEQAGLDAAAALFLAVDRMVHPAKPDNQPLQRTEPAGEV